MDSQVFKMLSSISTSNQWSLLSAIVKKLNRKLKDKTVEEIHVAKFLLAAGKETLKQNGIWIHKVGETDLIININCVYGRARQAEKDSGTALAKGACTCRGLINRKDENTQYFNSHDYNGGRHACSNSLHIGSCPGWAPSTSSHLHSWRRKHTK